MTFEELKTLRADDGTRFGDRVIGSVYVRNFCWECGEPIRTNTAALVRPQYCKDCQDLGGIEEHRKILTRNDIFDLMETAICDDYGDELEEIEPYKGFRICAGKDLDKFPFTGGE